MLSMSEEKWWDLANWKEDEAVANRFHEYFKSMGFTEVEKKDGIEYTITNREGDDTITCTLFGNVFRSIRDLASSDYPLIDGQLIESPDDIQFFFERCYRHALFFYKRDRGL